MYERFFDLRERPFSLTPDPDYLYLSRVHREALGHIRYGIEGKAGFVVLTGEIGCGKTTLLQTVIRNLDERTSVSRLVNTILNPRELLEAILLDFGFDASVNRSKPHLLHDLGRFLVDQRAAGRLTLLVVDEAQNLSTSALEELRMLSNLETEKSKLIQILLVGQPSLRDLLAIPELEQFRQRVTVSYHLQSLAVDETAAYINHRLRRAARGVPIEFPRAVTDLIHGHSLGVPRKINVISDALLLFAYGEDRRDIDVDLASLVLEELESTGLMTPPSFSTHSVSVAPPVPYRGRRIDMMTRPAADGRREERAAAVLEARETADFYNETADFYKPPAVEPVRDRRPLPPPAAQAASRPYAQAPAARPHADAARPGGSDPYYRPPRQPQSAETFWSRMKRGLRAGARAAMGE